MNFNEITKKIRDFIENNKIIDIKNSSSEDLSVLSLSDALFCAEDIIRNKAFFEWIKKAHEEISKSNVRGEEKIVIDAWCWIWILWIFALIIWFDRCYFLESNSETLEYCKKLIEHLWLKNKSIFANCDAKKYKLKEKYDLLISETISSWFIEEDFPFIINNLKQYWKKNSIIIPEKFQIEIKNNQNEENNKTKFIFLESNKWFKKRKIYINSTTIKFITSAYIYDNICIKSWDCMSFLNERKIDLKNKKHKLFEFIF